jgi:hypothetical protein
LAIIWYTGRHDVRIPVPTLQRCLQRPTLDVSRYSLGQPLAAFPIVGVVCMADESTSQLGRRATIEVPDIPSRHVRKDEGPDQTFWRDNATNAIDSERENALL